MVIQSCQNFNVSLPSISPYSSQITPEMNAAACKIIRFWKQRSITVSTKKIVKRLFDLKVTKNHMATME